ncbi:bile acid:sodium symporter family protein [Chondromyces crocatus]|uniref:Membrane protein n=1 Tax=Chondromyces crocatus TaxID=52 RepID=A0A0K1END2_CHOCO|nr:bile acid:sodium symporter family protein [Chondromyces crocatus]AKT42369.1 membrane protein [Chondromyces crocatus]
MTAPTPVRSPLRSAWRRLLPDNFTLALLGTVTLATLLPCRGEVARGFSLLTDLAIVLLFFLHGAKLSREAILSGLAHYRLHLLVFASTFVLFPALGLLTGLLPSSLLGPELASGFLFLCLLPSTVQSSIAFTSMAGGNVPAAVCSASISNVLGIFITPVLTGALLGAQGAGVSLGAIRSILLQLLAPFVLGHLLRPVIGAFVDRHKSVLSLVDRGSILLVVYTAFSEAVVEGLWQKVSGFDLAVVLAVSGLILALALAVTTWGARALGFSREDEIAIVFCGSKKSLASGVPMAGVLFPAATVGVMIVPLMLFHQIQLMVCAVLARRYAEKPSSEDAERVAREGTPG